MELQTVGDSLRMFEFEHRNWPLSHCSVLFTSDTHARLCVPRSQKLVWVTVGVRITPTERVDCL